jgi:hypothetical protein
MDPHLRSVAFEETPPSGRKWHPLAFFFFMAAIGLCGMVATSPRELTYDEPFHLEGARLLVSGLTVREMLVTPSPSAPGPLYPVLHAILQPLTGFEAPAVRYVNVALLLMSVTALSITFRRWHGANAWLLAGMIFGIPMTWVTTGMALTEIPAFAMAAFAVSTAIWATHLEHGIRWRCYSGFLASGILTGLAIAGRQTYLPMVAAFVAIAIVHKQWRWPAALGAMASCLISLPIFIVWGGLTPPSQAFAGGGIALKHGLLAFAYLAVTVAIVAPRFYAARLRWSMAAAGLSFIMNALLVRFEWKAAVGLAKHLPNALVRHYPTLVGSVLIAAVAAFLVAVIVNLWRRRDDNVYLLVSIQTLLLTATAFGIAHNFSSRYVMTSFPFVLLMAQPFFAPSRAAAARLVGGALLGAASLSSYYW